MHVETTTKEREERTRCWRELEPARAAHPNSDPSMQMPIHEGLEHWDKAFAKTFGSPVEGPEIATETPVTIGESIGSVFELICCALDG